MQKGLHPQKCTICKQHGHKSTCKDAPPTTEKRVEIRGRNKPNSNPNGSQPLVIQESQAPNTSINKSVRCVYKRRTECGIDEDTARNEK
ncbi:hypothetical protein K1719_046423 [Acacia pycnantha]|nr:hypothetical protein K1719_046423 [Acacia pycnantha]